MTELGQTVRLKYYERTSYEIDNCAKRYRFDPQRYYFG